jgi:mRNA-degrading endonuclease toxin of MazEF toxin-antitoxin module
MSQSNTHEGDILVTANEDLSTYADVLVAPYNSAGQLVVTRPAANNDAAVYVLVYGATTGAKATVRPLNPNRTVRVTAKGTGNPGDSLALADGVTTAADKGKVRKPTTTGTYRLVGIAEEAFVDGQLVRMRPTFGSVTI